MMSTPLKNAEKNEVLLSHLQKRRSVPSLNLAGDRPDDTKIAAMLEIAARVPDHGKLAPWRFVVYPQIAGGEIGTYLSQLWGSENAEASEERLELEKIRFARAPLVIGVVSCPIKDHKIPIWEQELSAGAVCLNLIHAAYGYGYIGQWLTEWYTFNEAAARHLGAGAGERFAGFIHIGSPTIEPSERPRPVINDITTTWSGSAA
ncbi:MAG: nitroreductase [Hyphomicrobiales bacterium]